MERYRGYNIFRTVEVAPRRSEKGQKDQREAAVANKSQKGSDSLQTVNVSEHQ